MRIENEMKMCREIKLKLKSILKLSCISIFYFSISIVLFCFRFCFRFCFYSCRYHYRFHCHSHSDAFKLTYHIVKNKVKLREITFRVLKKSRFFNFFKFQQASLVNDSIDKKKKNITM